MHRKPCSNSCWSIEPRSKSGPARTFLLIGLSSILSANAYAGNDTQSCPPSPSLVPEYLHTDRSSDQTSISADSTRARDDGTAVFEGDVVINSKGRIISSDRATWNHRSQQFILNGNVGLDTGNMQMQAEHGNYHNESGSGVFHKVEYHLGDRSLRGSAESIDTLGRGTTSIMHNSSLTSCPPDDIDWLLEADKIEIDHEESYGKAEDVTLEFKGVTFFYTPYMEFPIGDKRRSGLLAPEWSDSDSRGFELIVPWYWNIAPQVDAIIAPHHMSRRGLQLDTSTRFLTRSTYGHLENAYLHEDDVTGEKRYQTRYRQNTTLSRSTTLELDVNDVSDTEYFDDFSNNLAVTSQTHLNRSASLRHSSGQLRSSLLVQSHETIDRDIAATNRPYRKLPQIRTRGKWWLGDSGLTASIDASFTEFDHELESKTRGRRLNLTPELAMNWQGAYWFAKPALRLSHIGYQLEDMDDPQSLNLVTGSLDTGLFFERPLNDGLIQTLEPRLFYLRTPFEDQSGNPVFDSSIPTFSFEQLFRKNRFNGGDRIGDADQLTAALSSRIISTTSGDEYLRASIGQIVYLDDREVSIANSIETDQQSDLVAELGSQWQDWRFRANWQWDNTTSTSDRQNFLLRYQSDHNKVFNLAYRRQDSLSAVDEIEQSDISFIAPVSTSTTLFARWNYSFVDDEDIDVIAGIGYESCCWSLRVLAQRNRIDSSDSEYDNSIQFQLVFKGLGSVTGNRLSRTLSNAIPGYEEDF